MIEFLGYTVSRGNFELNIPKLALDGRRNFLIGKNGSGKTTFLHSIAGLIKSEGKLLVNGTDISSYQPESRRIALIPQDILLFPTMTVRQNIEFSVVNGKGDRNALGELIEFMDLEKLLDRRTSEISQGEAQRAAIARSIVSRPELLLLDEPFSFQDEISRLNMIALLDELALKYEFDYIYATHDSRDFVGGFSTLTTIDDGVIVESVDSKSRIEHFRTLSLLDFKNLVQIDGQYFKVNDDAISFDDSKGIEYEDIGEGNDRKLRFKMNGRYYFISIDKPPGGKYLNVNLTKLVRIQY